MVICIIVTIGVKTLWNKITKKKAN
jgi:hypothetical protein